MAPVAVGMTDSLLSHDRVAEKEFCSPYIREAVGEKGFGWKPFEQRCLRISLTITELETGVAADEKWQVEFL
jgi:hypothetical protein